MMAFMLTLLTVVIVRAEDDITVTYTETLTVYNFVAVPPDWGMFICILIVVVIVFGAFSLLLRRK